MPSITGLPASGPPAQTPRICLSAQEVQQLVLCRDFVLHLLPEVMRQNVDQAIARSATLLADPAVRPAALASVAQASVKGHIDYTAQGALLQALCAAIQDRQVCEIRYQAASKPTLSVHHIAPLRLVAYREALYLQAYKVTERGVPEIVVTMLLAVHRLKELTPLRRHFDLPEPDQETDGLFGLMAASPSPWRRAGRGRSLDVRERRWSSDCDPDRRAGWRRDPALGTERGGSVVVDSRLRTGGGTAGAVRPTPPTGRTGRDPGGPIRSRAGPPPDVTKSSLTQC